jgi:hypothetical protein
LLLSPTLVFRVIRAFHGLSFPSSSRERHNQDGSVGETPTAHCFGVARRTRRRRRKKGFRVKVLGFSLRTTTPLFNFPALTLRQNPALMKMDLSARRRQHIASFFPFAFFARHFVFSDGAGEDAQPSQLKVVFTHASTGFTFLFLDALFRLTAIGAGRTTARLSGPAGW